MSAPKFAGVLGEALFKMRKALGLTLHEAAQRAGVTRQTIYSIETGASDPSLSTFVNLCLALDAEPANVLRAALKPPRR
jgi:DNA-binding XRE family transcriptional regulator